MQSIISQKAFSNQTSIFFKDIKNNFFEGKQVGKVSIRAPTSDSFDTVVSNTLANTALATAMGGTASHDGSEDGFSVILKCHTDSGELYNVAFKREKISVSSYEADSILTTIETWADTISELA